MAIEGWYVLYEDRSLKYHTAKNGYSQGQLSTYETIVDIWPFDPDERLTAYEIIITSALQGVGADRINQLAHLWSMTREDLEMFLTVTGVTMLEERGRFYAMKKGQILLNGARGLGGATTLEALVMLAGELGYKPSKTMKTNFVDLLK
jgi:hypothetical protein